METILLFLERTLSWVLQASCYASLLVGLILFIQLILRKSLPAQWSHLLWVIVLLRLMVPWHPESRVSLFNLSQGPLSIAALSLETATPVLQPKSFDRYRPIAPGKTSATARQFPAPPIPQSAHPADARPAAHLPRDPQVGLSPMTWNWSRRLAVLWLLGVVAFASRIWVANYWVKRYVRRLQPVKEPWLWQLLDDCQREVRLKKQVQLRIAPDHASPGLLGMLHPHILLPQKMIASFDRDEIRFLLLHELAHIRRHDLATNHLAAVCQALHWFNPVIWYACRRMRDDMELACDAAVLSHTQPDDYQAYGRTAIKVLETFASATSPLGALRISGTKTSIKRRILMISRFRKPSLGQALLGLSLLLVLGAIGLTEPLGAESPVAATQTKSEDSQHAVDQAVDLAVDAPEPAVTKVASKTPAGLTLAATEVSTETLVSGKEHVTGGILSPDETKIAYVDYAREKKMDVVVRDLRTGKEVAITQTDYDDPDTHEMAGEFGFWTGCWSPDSQWVAYRWAKYPRGEIQLRIAKADGSETRVLKESNEDSNQWYPTAWSPQGELLIRTYGWGPNGGNTALLNIETGESTEFPMVYDGGLSLDGQWIVGVNEKDNNGNIHLINVRTRQITPLVDDPTDERAPVFTKDGRYVLFSSDRRGEWDLWAVRVNNGARVGDPVLVKTRFGKPLKRLLPSGKIAYGSYEQNRDVYSITIGSDRNDPISEPRRLSLSHLGDTCGPTWSPDGNQVAFRTGKMLRIQTLDTGKVETIDTQLKWIGRMLYWSPDGRHLAFQGGEGNDSSDIYLTSIDDKRTRPLKINEEPVGGSNGRRRLRCHGWSWDGTQLYTEISVDGHEKRVAVDVQTGNTTEITFPEFEDPVNEYHIAPDGERVLVVIHRQLVLLNRTTGHKQTIASHAEGSGGLRGPRWSPNGKFFAYFDLSSEALVVMSADTKSKRTVSVEDVPMSSFGKPPAWSPDSKKVAYTVHHGRLYEIGLLSFELP